MSAGKGNSNNGSIEEFWDDIKMSIIRKKLRIISIKFINYIDFLSKLKYNGHVTDRRMNDMRISYKKLWILLIEKEISPVMLRKDLNIATGTMTKLRRNEEVALSVLLRICDYLECNIGDICEAVKTENG